MKRLIGLLAVLGAVLVAGAGPARSLPVDPPSPVKDAIAQVKGDRDTALACADIKDGSPEMIHEADGSWTVNFRELLFDPACPGVDYRFNVTNPDTGALITAVAPTSGDGTEAAPLQYSAPVRDSDVAHHTDSDGPYATVCVSAATSIAGATLDSAPDTGCVGIREGSSPGTRFR